MKACTLIATLFDIGSIKRITYIHVFSKLFSLLLDVENFHFSKICLFYSFFLSVSHFLLPNELLLGEFRVLTLTDIVGCGGYQQHTVTLGNQQWPHTHTLLCFGPLSHPTPFPPPLMDCFPHSPCLACAAASQDSRRPLGTALFSFSLTPNLQTVSNFTHKLPSFLDFQPYWVSCFVFTAAEETVWGVLVAFESASTQWRRKKIQSNAGACGCH